MAALNYFKKKNDLPGVLKCGDGRCAQLVLKKVEDNMFNFMGKLLVKKVCF